VELGAREVDVGGEQLHAARVDDRIAGFDPLQQDVVERRRARFRLEPEREREAGLGVEVDEQHPLAQIGQGEADGLGRRGLGDAAFLVGDREYPRHGGRVYERAIFTARAVRVLSRWVDRPIEYTIVPFVTSLTQ
jgi:hypothetical protein